MNQERAKTFMRDFDKVLEKLRDTTSVQEINELKEYFVNEYTEIFCVKYNFKEMITELERIEKRNKKIKDVEEKLITSILLELFTNYEGIESDRTLSTIQKIVLYQKSIDDMKRRHIYFATNQGKLLEKCFILGRNIYKEMLKESGLSRQWAHFLQRIAKLIEDYSRILYCTIDLKFIKRNFKIIQEICERDPDKWR